MGSELAYHLAIATIIFILVFDYTNGFHDASNIIGTVVACNAMTPMRAVILIGIFEFLGPIIGGTAVANTIGHFIVVDDLPSVLASLIIMSGVVGAIVWNLLTWWFGLPSSSSHALVGGLIGAVVLAVGNDHVVWGGRELLGDGHLTGFTKVLISLVISPLIGFGVGFLLHRVMRLLLTSVSPAFNQYLKQAQMVTASVLAFSHGANDAQKSMGIITLILWSSGIIPSFQVPLWVMVMSALLITMGILSGGWRIARTVGFGIYRLRVLHALDSQLTAASVILTASMVGAPVSTTHVVSSSLMGIGSSEWPKRVHWAKAIEIILTWLITIPFSAMMGALIFWILRRIITV